MTAVRALPGRQKSGQRLVGHNHNGHWAAHVASLLVLAFSFFLNLSARPLDLDLDTVDELTGPSFKCFV